MRILKGAAMAATKVLRGVNLTGWLTLEPWVTPEPFARTATVDEVSLAAKLGKDEYAELVRAHRASFIHSEDFSRIAARGFNALRLPIPWYVFEPQNTPYQPCIDMVDKALEWAEEIGLHVIFVLAVNPGLPDGQDSTPGGSPRTRISCEKSLEIIKKLAQRYAHRLGFFGIEVADEVQPRIRQGLRVIDGVPAHSLRNYYRRAYNIVRMVAGEDPVVILPDGGWPSGWRRFMSQQSYTNVWLDCHLDRTPSSVDCSGPLGIQRVIDAKRSYLLQVSSGDLPVMVGKWSASLPTPDGSMTAEGRIALERIYASGQLAAYRGCPAWFFQTWKTSAFLAGWDARVALASFERGMLN